MPRTALYRHFCSAGCLLYIGIAQDPGKRLAQHFAASPWAQQIERVTMMWHETRTEAEIAEIAAIAAEKPLFNRRGVGLKTRRFGVLHRESKGFDGAYFDAQSALDVMGYWQKCYPTEVFEVISDTDPEWGKRGMVGALRLHGVRRKGATV